MDLKKIVAEHLEEFISFRHHIHSNPELSFQEKNTADFIAFFNL